MSNIEKLLDSLLKLKGDKLVVGVGEPIYVIKSGRQMVLMKKPLGDREFYFIDSEYSRMFSDKETFEFNGTRIFTGREGKRREFSTEPLGEIGSPPPSTTPPQPQAEPVKGPPTTSPEPIQAAPPPSPPQDPIPAAPAPPQDSYVATPPVPDQDESIVVAASPVEKTLDLDHLLSSMLEKNSSDLHLTTSCHPMMRIDGDIMSLEEYPLVDETDLYNELIRIAPERNIEEFKETNDTDFAYEIPGAARYRANIFRDTKGVGAVFRVIPSKILTVEQLSVPDAMVKLCEIPKGLILVTGPTGSGKSTTLAALIDHINSTQKKHIITIEDPVEFVHPQKEALINQREIHSHTQSFKRALRAALREDPDIILVGEMRDLETIAIAIEMAVTGHLVFGTLHTSTAIGTVDRIIDQFPSDQQSQIKTMLADALIGVCAQTLPKRKGGGRVGAYEVLVVTNAVSNLIREGKNYQIATLMQTGKGLGMQMINSHLTELVEKNIIEPEEAISKAVEKDNLKSMLKQRGLYKGE